MIKVFLADQQEIVREGIKSILENNRDFDIVGEASSFEAVLLTINEHDIDVLVVDLACFQPDSTAALLKIIQVRPKLGVYVLTDDIDPVLARQAIAVGALGYSCKSIELPALVAGLRLVAAGRPSIDGKVAEHLATELSENKFGLGYEISLTQREYDVYIRLANGESYKKIACTLKVSPKTVAVHKSRIFAKLQIDCMSRLVQHAIHNELLEPRV